MADDDMADMIYDDDDEIEWDYVEDTYPLADELAETSVPDPGYSGTAGELDDWWLDLDLFDYWIDLQYGSDSYWDSGPVPATGEKRERGLEQQGTPVKRRKLSLRETGGDTSIYVDMEERRRIWSRRAPVRKELKTFALLPDWRKRCATPESELPVKAMPTEMRQAAEGNDEDTPEGQRHFDAEAVDGEEGDWEDEDDEGEGGDLQAELASLDPEILKSILRQKMGDAGLEGIDEGAFMQTITKMLAGDGGADEAAGELANSLLGQASQGENGALSGWLSQQGVSLDQEDEEDVDDADSVMGAEVPASTRDTNKGKATQTSPSDSAVEFSRAGRTREMALHDGSPKAAKKRLAPIADEDEGTAKKQKTVKFNMPASRETDAANAVPGAHEASASAPAPTTTTTSVEPDVPTTAATSKPARGKGKAPSKGAADPSSTNVKNSSTKATSTKVAAPKAEPAPVQPSGPAKATRKRKAQAEETEDETPPPQKKQTRKAAATEGEDAKPGYARATRSTRARSGK